MILPIAAQVAPIATQIFAIVLDVFAIVFQIALVRLQVLRVLLDVALVASLLVFFEIRLVARDVAGVLSVVNAIGAKVAPIMTDVPAIVSHIVLRGDHGS